MKLYTSQHGLKWRRLTMKHRPCGNGKGDTPRPIKDRKQFESNWDSIFKKKDKQDAEMDGNNTMPDRDSTNKS